MTKNWTAVTPMTLFLGATLMAQAPQGSRPVNANMTLVLPVVGAPLVVEQIEERQIKLPNGLFQTKTQASKVYRDAVGRMRVESTLSGPSGENALIVEIQDPVAGFIAMLTPDKVAHRVTTPKIDLSVRGGIGFLGFVVTMPGTNRKKENLGKRTIEGIDCEGIRTTGTSDDQPPRSAVDERWFSTELRLVPLVLGDSPDEHYSARIIKITREDPDPRLFVIPKEYAIQDLGDWSKE